MKTSLRRRLLAAMLVVFCLSWAVVTVATYFESHHEIEELFDAQLAQEAGILAELVLDSLESTGERHNHLSQEIYGHKYERYISFQVWEGDTLHFRSFASPETRLSQHHGFSDQELKGVHWRVFAMNDKSGRYTILTAESYQARHELIEDITLSALAPLLVALPLIAVLVWVGVGQSMRPLEQVAQEVSQRSPEQLEPISEQDIPREISPVIESVNGLLNRLRQAFEAERRFAADASHELRTPLAGIKTQAQVALRAREDESRNQALANIVTGVDRSTHLVEQMLTLARLSPEIQGKGVRSPLELAPVVQEVMADLEPAARKAGIRLNLECENPLDKQCRVYGYAPGIAVMMRNLLDNAIAHSPPGGEILVSLQHHAGGCCLTVADQGKGIQPEERERIFDAFYRPAGQELHGSGLGLAIVKRVCILHHAALSVMDGQSGTGTLIKIDFPPSP